MFRLALILVFSFILLTLVFGVLMKWEKLWMLARAHRKNPNATKDKPTMFHVRELILADEKELAIQLYCQIFNVNHSQAKREVENLEKSIKEKNA